MNLSGIPEELVDEKSRNPEKKKSLRMIEKSESVYSGLKPVT